MDGEEDNRDRRTRTTETAGDFETAHAGHRNIEHDDIGPQGPDRCERRRPVLHRADNLALLRQGRGRAFENDVAVVDEKDAWMVDCRHTALLTFAFTSRMLREARVTSTARLKHERPWSQYSKSCVYCVDLSR